MGLLVHGYYSGMLRIWSKLALLARGERYGWNGTVSMTRDTWTWLGTWESIKRIESVREVQKEHSGPQEGQLEEGWKIPLNPHLDSGYIYHQHSLSFHEGRTHPSFMSFSCHGACQQYYFLHYMTSLPRQLSPQGWSSEKRKEGRQGSRVGCKGSEHSLSIPNFHPGLTSFGNFSEDPPFVEKEASFFPLIFLEKSLVVYSRL